MEKKDILKIVEELMESKLEITSMGSFHFTYIGGKKELLDELDKRLDKLFVENDLSKF